MAFEIENGTLVNVEYKRNNWLSCPVVQAESEVPEFVRNCIDEFRRPWRILCLRDEALCGFQDKEMQQRDRNGSGILKAYEFDHEPDNPCFPTRMPMYPLLQGSLANANGAAYSILCQELSFSLGEVGCCFCDIILIMVD